MRLPSVTSCQVLIESIQSRSDLFPPESFDAYYSLERFHISGSRILSRSFTVESWNSEGHDDSANDQDEGMEVDPIVEAKPTSALPKATHDEGAEGSDEDDEEQADHVCMAPMADMLNARNGYNNVCSIFASKTTVLSEKSVKRLASSTKRTPSTCVPQNLSKRGNK